jgi:hypothetical protein
LTLVSVAKEPQTGYSCHSRVLQSVMLPRAKLALGPLAFRFAPDRVLTFDRVSGVKLSPHFALAGCSDCSCLSYRIASHYLQTSC